jgi:hypothetical protein
MAFPQRLETTLFPGFSYNSKRGPKSLIKEEALAHITYEILFK